MAKLNDKQIKELQLLSLEKNDKGKNKYTQQQLGDMFGISKGMVNRYIKEKVNKSKQIIDTEVRICREFENLQKEKSKHLSKSEQIEVNNQIKSKLHYQGIIYNQIESALNYNSNILSDGYVEDKINIGDGMQKFEKRALNTNDTMNIVKTADTALVALEIAPRHAKNSLEVNNSNQNLILEIE